MAKNTKTILLIAGLATVLASCGGKTDYEVFDIKDNEYIPSTYKGKTTYKSYIATPLKSLNTALTMQAENGTHIANFVDGLLENDAYGRLSKALAEKVFVNDTYDEYKFYIRGNELGKGTSDPIKWLQWDGTQYVDREEGAQVVTGKDFYTASKYVLDQRNSSDCYYLPAMFIKGGYEYWAYTFACYWRDVLNKENPIGFDLSTNAGLARATNMFAKQYGHQDLNVTAADIPNIANFSRVGISYGTEKDSKTGVEYYYVKYQLQQPASYFPSVLTYTPFYPVNEAFVRNKVGGIKQFGRNTKENFLYCGAFLLNEWDSSGKLVYKKNNEYWDKDKVHVEQITYEVLSDEKNEDFIRKEYESGKIDSFGVSQSDEEGWKKYVTGQNNEGSIENPVNSDVYSREIDTVDSTFYTQLNVNRKEWTKNRSNITEPEMTNANAAIKINAVRELLLNGVDLTLYNQRYGLTGDLRDQYQMWTFIPKGFVENTSNGKDYIEYLYEEYSANTGLPMNQVRELLKQGQLPASYNPTSQTQDLAKKAIAAINYVNSVGGVTYKDGNNKSVSTKIDFPVKFEYLGLNYDAKQSVYDSQWIERFNETVNACTVNPDNVKDGLPRCSGGKYPYIEIVKNTKVNASNYTEMGENGEYHMYVVGWGADYADPLTYLNTQVSGGDMSSYAGTASEVPDYIMDFNEDGTVKAETYQRKDSMLDRYDDLVARGAGVRNNLEQRFRLFAQAEYELLFNVHIMQPNYMSGQGWTVTVSRLAGYETPTAAYGLSSYKLKGVYALTTAMGGADRKAAKEKFNANKAKALAETSDEDIYEKAA